jgi:NTE family protein
MAKQTALVLAGAVAKGAFHAGVLKEVAVRDMNIVSVLGTSAGALNALVYAAGVAVNKETLAAQEIEDLWRDRAGFWSVISPDLGAWVRLRGLSNLDRVRTMLRSALRAVLGDARVLSKAGKDLTLTLVATDLRGHPDHGDGGAGQTTYETAFTFTGADFLDAAVRERMVDAAIASAAFPIMFSPEHVRGGSAGAATGSEIEEYVDGGAVNNAPISYVLEGTAVGRVLVVSTEPPNARHAPRAWLGRLATELVEILINERLHRDLVRARKTNAKLKAVHAALAEARADPRVVAAVDDALGWKELEIVELSPSTALPGNPFSGFFSKGTRETYIEKGHATGIAKLPLRKEAHPANGPRADAP